MGAGQGPNPVQSRPESSLSCPAKAEPADHLPDAYQHQFFKVPEDWSDKKLTKRVESNPLSDLCLRLATYSVGPNNNRCLDPKRQGIVGSKRLYLMIGHRLDRGTFNRMLASSSRQWKFVEECWIANMHTVLLNQCFDPVTLDRKLFGAIQRYKLWFIKFAFSGTRRTVKRKDGRRFRVFVPVNSERLLTGLKKIAGWLQWAALSDMRKHNASPPAIPYWKGWHSETQSLELEWFGGHLLRWKSCLTDLRFTDRELANLCQIRTFGRALPVPTKGMCREAFIEQMNVLTNEHKTPDNVLRVVSNFSTRLGLELNVRQMPYYTHISVSTSGCFERSQSEGGLAAEARDWISDLDIPLSEVRVGGFLLTGQFPVSLTEFLSSSGQEIDILDVYGEMMFPRPKSFYGFSSGLMKVGLKKKELSLLDALYNGAGLSSKKRKASKLLEEESLPPSLGKALLALSSAKALQQGFFVSDVDGLEYNFEYYLHFNGWRVPFYQGNKRVNHHLLYRPVDMPKAKLDCLAEPGAKTRPLGKNQAWFTFVTRAMRFMAEPIIARDGRARIGLRSTNKMWSFLKYIKNRCPEYKDIYCQSTDFKSATDLIPLDILKAVWSGFCKSLPKRHPFWVYYSLIDCQRAIFKARHFKDLEDIFPEGILNLRGSFMGEPMSFLTLTLENLLAEEISAYYYHNSRIPMWSLPGPIESLVGDPTCICGDDVASIRSDLRRILLFRAVCLAMGWKFSWKEGISKRILIFCEDHSLVSGTGRDFKIVYVDVIKSRLLTTMSREHSDNRSSILGKGRMLSNQLDYFEDKNLKIAILGYFRNIFDRCYDYNVIKNQACKMPIYLPPCVGGLGLPIVDSIMPSFMWPYIGYIYKLLDIEVEFKRMFELKAVASLNRRAKHGISSDVSVVLEKEISRLVRATPGEKGIKSMTVYDDSFIITLLQEAYGINVPSDPYTNGYDFSSLQNEASRLGFIPLSSFSDEIERVMNFQKFLKNGAEKEPRSFNRWVKESRRFWKTALRNEDQTQLAKVGKRRFKSVAQLEKSVIRGFSGWIYVGEDLHSMTLINSGPSLKVTFSRSLTLGGKMHLYGDSFREE